MSEALDYLIGARPEAMTAYFKFIKQAGEHLDPKTRSLISVITKVATQTEKGFKQYLKRAMRDGATANEVLDALLMAFPVLGLSKTIWAIEQLQEMDLPEFDLAALKAEGKVEQQWHDIIKLSDIREGTHKVSFTDRAVFIYKLCEEVKVYDTRCPHQATDLPEPAEGCEVIVCPTHGWRFDLSLGENVEKGSHALKEYKVQEKDGLLQAWW